MAKISTYPLDGTPNLGDKLIGTDIDNLNATKNYTIGQILSVPGSSAYVPYTGATGNVDLGSNNLTANSFVKVGGLSTQFLKADGSIDSNTYLTTAAAALTYVPYTGATGDVDLGNNSIIINGGIFYYDANDNLSLGVPSLNSNGLTNIHIGLQAGSGLSGNRNISIGEFAGFNATGSNNVNIGISSGNQNNQDHCVFIGRDAGGGVTGNTGDRAVGIGFGSAVNNQGINSVAIGYDAGSLNQGDNVVLIGDSGGTSNEGNEAVAIGSSAGSANKGNDVNLIGNSTGSNNEGDFVNAMGPDAASNNTGDNVNAFGDNAGQGNSYSEVNLFGPQAAATANNQTVFAGSANQVLIDYNNITANREYTAPDDDGILVLSVNGQVANNFGDVILPPTYYNSVLPTYLNYAAALAALGGSPAGFTYIYHDQTTNSIGAVRL